MEKSRIKASVVFDRKTLRWKEIWSQTKCGCDYLNFTWKVIRSSI